MAISWFAKQYEDVKGNFKWALLGPLWTAISWAANHILHMIPQMADWAIWSIVLFTSSIVFVFVARRQSSNARLPQNMSQSITNTLMTSPTLDATAYFKTAYASTLQQEIENNTRAAATQNQPNDREGFYVKLIATALPAFMYDIAWAYIFKSQLLLLQELNRRVLLLAEVKPYYEKAASDNSTLYADYSFDQWLGFMKSHVLLIQHPNGMIEITIRGRDFLKYLVHCGRSIDDRKF
jgi:hypothetical protein